MRLCSVPPRAPAAAAALKGAARNARLSFRAPVGGSSWRMRFSACASGTPASRAQCRIPPPASAAASLPTRSRQSCRRNFLLQPGSA
eukprot:3948985-Pleurochrysis_carterae.AAC.1